MDNTPLVDCPSKWLRLEPDIARGIQSQITESIGNISALSIDGRMDMLGRMFHRYNYTGRNQTDITLNGQKLEGANETSGVFVFNWLNKNAGENTGVGPGIACGTLGHALLAAGMAYDVLMRMVMVSAFNTADNVVEFWSPLYKRWVLHVQWLNARVYNRYTNDPISYIELATAKPSERRDVYQLRSPYFNLPINRSIDWLARVWQDLLFVDGASISNGNAVFINPWHPKAKLQFMSAIIDPKANERPNAWGMGLHVSRADLYPNLSANPPTFLETIYPHPQ